jgi:hypothetical protein
MTVQCSKIWLKILRITKKPKFIDICHIKTFPRGIFLASVMPFGHTQNTCPQAGTSNTAIGELPTIRRA